MYINHGILRDPISGILGGITEDYRADSFEEIGRWIKADGSAELHLKVLLKADMPTSTQGLPDLTMTLRNVPERDTDYERFRALLRLGVEHPEMGSWIYPPPSAPAVLGI